MSSPANKVFPSHSFQSLESKDCKDKHIETLCTSEGGNDMDKQHHTKLEQGSPHENGTQTGGLKLGVGAPGGVARKVMPAIGRADAGDSDERQARKRAMHVIYSRRKRLKKKTFVADTACRQTELIVENRRLKEEACRLETLLSQAKKIVVRHELQMEEECRRRKRIAARQAFAKQSMPSLLEMNCLERLRRARDPQHDLPLFGLQRSLGASSLDAATATARCAQDRRSSLGALRSHVIRQRHDSQLLQEMALKRRLDSQLLQEMALKKRLLSSIASPLLSSRSLLQDRVTAANRVGSVLHATVGAKNDAIVDALEQEQVRRRTAVAAAAASSLLCARGLIRENQHGLVLSRQQQQQQLELERRRLQEDPVLSSSDNSLLLTKLAREKLVGKVRGQRYEYTPTPTGSITDEDGFSHPAYPDRVASIPSVYNSNRCGSTEDGRHIDHHRRYDPSPLGDRHTSKMRAANSRRLQGKVAYSGDSGNGDSGDEEEEGGYLIHSLLNKTKTKRKASTTEDDDEGSILSYDNSNVGATSSSIGTATQFRHLPSSFGRHHQHLSTQFDFLD